MTGAEAVITPSKCDPKVQCGRVAATRKSRELLVGVQPCALFHAHLCGDLDTSLQGITHKAVEKRSMMPDPILLYGLK